MPPRPELMNSLRKDLGSIPENEFGCIGSDRAVTQEQYGTDAALLGAGTQSLSQIGRRYNTGYDGRAHLNGNNQSLTIAASPV